MTLGLTGFAISQPVLGLLGDNPATLTHHGIGGPSLVALALLIALVPPLVLWGVPALLGLAARSVGAVAHLVVVAVLAACLAVQLIKSVGLDAAVPLALLATAVGVGFALAYARMEWVATWASYTAILPVMAVVFLLFGSPASALLDEVDDVDRVDRGLPSVVLIVLDELPTRSILGPDEQLDRDRVPNLARFAEDATWYRHHTSLVPSTQLSVPTILTGRAPRVVQPLWTRHPDNLFTLLAPTHELEVMEAATLLCPYRSCEPTTVDGEAVVVPRPGFGDAVRVSWDLWRDRVRLGPTPPSRLDDFAEEVEVAPSPEVEELDSGVTGATAVPGDGRGLLPDGTAMKATSARADAFQSLFDPAKGSALYYLHLLLPHQPWTFYPDGTMYSEPDPLGWLLPEEERGIRFAWSDWAGTISEQRALLQLQYTDQLLGRILDHMQESGIYDESMVIVTSDHGFSFEPGTRSRAVTDENLEALTYTPLLVKLPDQTEGEVDDSNVSSLDVLPSIADRLGLELTWSVDGAPLWSEEVAARDGTKVVRDVVGLGDLVDNGDVTYNDAERFAQLLRDRRVGPLTDPTDPLSGLPVPADVRGLTGAPPPADIEVRGSGELIGGDQVADARGASEPLGVVEGIVDGTSAGSGLLVVDDVVVAASEASELDGTTRYIFLVPAGTFHDRHEVRLLVQVSDGLVEVDLG